MVSAGLGVSAPARHASSILTKSAKFTRFFISTNTIPLNEAALLLDKLLTESIPVVAVFVSPEGSRTILRGFVDNITADDDILVSAIKGKPATSSKLSIPFPGEPLGSDCRFGFGDKREIDESQREELAAKYGDAALVVFLPSGSRLNLLFTP